VANRCEGGGGEVGFVVVGGVKGGLGTHVAYLCSKEREIEVDLGTWRGVAGGEPRERRGGRNLDGGYCGGGRDGCKRVFFQDVRKGEYEVLEVLDMDGLGVERVNGSDRARYKGL